MKALFILPAALLAAAALAHAGTTDNYQEPIGAYKNDLKAKEPELINASYYGDHATSTAKRALARANIDGRTDAAESRLERNGGGDVNVASPQIFGTVRGDVTIVMQKGAVKGGITSVRR
jgi:hypothetical protein